MKLFSSIPAYLRNKYFLVAVAFFVWMMFFDRNDIFTQLERRKELKGLQKSKQYFTSQISGEQKSLEELQSNPAAIEKYAREKYGMKRDNEEVFIIQKAEKE
jgi:cell division protein FtsB